MPPSRPVVTPFAPSRGDHNGPERYWERSAVTGSPREARRAGR